jgi:lactate dehydrogenase-like 2-hydroxyacid dehydrogenase/predicted dehydrogenase
VERDAELVLLNKVVLSAPVLSHLPGLGYVGVLATGYNCVDVSGALRRGITVTNVPVYGTQSMAQVMFAHLLHYTQGVAAGRWTHAPDWCYWERPLIERVGRTMGIVGFGRIGRATAALARAFGMPVLACDSQPVDRSDLATGVDLETLFRDSDVIGLHCPLTAQTRQLVNPQRLALMKPSAYPINTSRGVLIDESALEAGRLAGSGLDVLAEEPPSADHPLLRARNCTITPHIAWATRQARRRLLDAAVENVRGFLAGLPKTSSMRPPEGTIPGSFGHLRTSACRTEDGCEVTGPRLESARGGTRDMTTSRLTTDRTQHGEGSISRRRFLSGAAAVLGVPAFVPGRALGRGGSVPASERITVGVIGTGNRGTADMLGVMSSPLSQVVAVCDCRRPRLDAAKAKVDQYYAGKAGSGSGDGCRAYHDFREVIDRGDIDAILVCPPDHWHGIIATRALRAGKDLYCEKPLGRTIAESLAVRDAAVKHDRVFQTGTQQRSDALFRQACTLARGGHLGKIHTIEVAVPAGGDIVKPPTAQVPDGFDYDLWTGPAPLHSFDLKRCEWLGMYWIADYCVGFICNWGIHHLDIAAWGCPEVVEAPFEIEGSGFVPTPGKGICDTVVTWRTEFRYPSGLRLSFTSDRGPFDWQKSQGLTEESLHALEDTDPKHHHDTGCRFIGDEGWVHVTRGAIHAEPSALLSKSIDPAAAGLAVSDDHYVNFLRSVRSRRAPVSTVESGHRATVLGNVADIAVRLGRKLKWDPRAERFLDDEEANRRLSQPMRSPWRLE